MSEQRGQPGTFIVGFGKPAPKLEKKAASYFAWSKQFITWAVTNTCDDALTETSDPITLQRAQPGTFIVGFGKPVPKLESKAGSYFPWSKQFITWAVTNTCDDALTETSDPIILQGPHAMSRGELEFRHGPNKVAPGRRAFEETIAAVTHNSPLPHRCKRLAALASRWLKFDGTTFPATT